MAAAATFFEHQHLARRNTAVMVVLFLLAVAAVITAVDLVISFVFLSMGEVEGLRRVPLGLHLAVAGVTAAIILLVSLVNVFKLADGGEAVAKMVEIGRAHV